MNSSATLKAIAHHNAQSCVERAIERGVIPAQNQTIKAQWMKLCENDADMIKMLDAMPGIPILTCGRITKPQPICSTPPGLVEHRN